jgi:CelD/BcsL family acetyltransferase involved in cellulose biosynthesis
MEIRAIPARELTPQHLDAWSALQQADPDLDSPLFRPEFTLGASALCDRVEVAIIEEAGEPVGFFPFERARGDVGIPVGGRLNDFHGAIARKGLLWSAAALVRGCRLSAWHFHNAPAAQTPLRNYSWAAVSSPYIDISLGYEAYCRAMKAKGSDEIRRAAQKARKIERELGALRLVPRTSDERAFDSLIQWKLQQYHRTKATNFLAGKWKIELLERFARTDGELFSGMLTGLYAGDRLAAVHLGLRAGAVLHGWFPAYDPELAEYSPGQVLWHKLIQAAPELGIRRIDLGSGDERYKTVLMSGRTAGCEGSVDLRYVTKWARRGWFQTCYWIKASPLRGVARGVARNTRTWLGRN